MKKNIFLSIFLLSASIFVMNSESAAAPSILIETSKGSITVELNEEKAPITVKNFLSYVDSGFFDGLIFHRVIPGFMIQGGGMTEDLKQKETQAPIKIESSNGLKNVKGSIAMARTGNPNSATAQFFINLVDNSFLDFRDSSADGIGYTVFGQTSAGMEVVSEIAKVQTTTKSGHSDVPVETVKIVSIKRAN
jgi:cyclophilin family peptidyl-prolyl cis-trans isomerase